MRNFDLTPLWRSTVGSGECAEVRARWQRLSLYQKFEHAVIFILSALIAVLVMLAV